LSFVDSLTGWLLTGDTVYPGRMYVYDFPAFQDSLERLVEWAERWDVEHVMGCHVEMTSTPGAKLPDRCTDQPDEPPLKKSMAQLVAVRDAALAIEARDLPKGRSPSPVVFGKRIGCATL
jgi:hydroxyacylglutathione hydrolase